MQGTIEDVQEKAKQLEKLRAYMADTFLLQVVSPERILVARAGHGRGSRPRRVYWCTARTRSSDLGTEAGGVLSYHSGGQRILIAVYGGFLEVLPIASEMVIRRRAQHGNQRRGGAGELKEASRKVEETKNDGGGEVPHPAVALRKMCAAQANPGGRKSTDRRGGGEKEQ